MTYLEIVNKVLVRLRENEVTSLNESSYSSLIADLVNVVKREVENSWNWHALRTTLSATTVDDLFNYVLVGFGTTSRVLHVYNDTDDIELYPKSSTWFDRQMRMVSTPQKGSPQYYNFNGVSAYGDLQMDVYPIPDKAYDIRINIVKQQDDLTEPTESILINPNVVIEGVVSRAIMERGEDGGSMDHELRYRNMLADLIAIEAGHRPDEVTWYPS
jgi:hypothetical protein